MRIWHTSGDRIYRGVQSTANSSPTWPCSAACRQHPIWMGWIVTSTKHHTLAAKTMVGSSQMSLKPTINQNFPNITTAFNNRKLCAQRCTGVQYYLLEVRTGCCSHVGLQSTCVSPWRHNLSRKRASAPFHLHRLPTDLWRMQEASALPPHLPPA